MPGGRTTAGNDTISLLPGRRCVSENAVARRSGIRVGSGTIFSCPAAAGELRSACQPNRQESPGFRPLTVVASITIYLRHPGYWADSPIGVHPFPSSAEVFFSRCVVLRVRHVLVSGASCRPLGHFFPSNSTPFQSAFGVSVKFSFVKNSIALASEAAWPGARYWHYPIQASWRRCHS